MRKYLILAFFALFIGCSTSDNPVPEPTDETPTTVVSDRPVWIKNAKWETVRTDELKASSRGLRVIDSLEALQEELDAHNAAHPENPWHLYVDTVPSIEEAPMCEVWVADFVTNALKTHPTLGIPFHLLVPRTDVVGRIPMWEADAAQVNGKLYLDYPPPAEVLPPVHDEAYWYAYYSIYAVGSTGLIHYQIHITEEDWAAGGYTSRDNMFEQKYRHFQAICDGDAPGQPDYPWHVVARQLYTEPE